MLSTRTPMRSRQGGAVIITTALLLLFLLGFMGVALDLGRLFILKTELQTSMDSCALAAVQELDGASDALTRATNAGLVAGNLNKINFQGEAAAVADAEVTFSDSLNGTYSRTFAPVANAKYARCLHTRAGIEPWLLGALTAFSGDATYSATRGAFAVGVATRSSAQSACAIPVRIRPRDTGDKTNFGLTPGEWISTLYDEKSDSTTVEPGHFGWVNLNPGVSSSAQAIRDQLLGNGACIKTDAGLSTTGAKFSAALEWNSRFGLYKNGAGSPKVTDAAPDLTGYSYTATNWPSQAGAAPDFLAKRATHRSYGNTVDTVNAGDTITGLNIKGGYKDGDMGTYSAGPRALATYGGSRRLVMAPVMEASAGKIDGWACVLMLHPIDSVKTTVYLEYVGNAGNPSSPCASGGLAGGASGPLVPVLVQ